MNDAGSFLVFRQTKYAVDGTTLAPVGGVLSWAAAVAMALLALDRT